MSQIVPYSRSLGPLKGASGFVVSGFMVSGFRFVDVPDGAGFAQFGSLEGSALQVFDKVVEAARERFGRGQLRIVLSLTVVADGIFPLGLDGR